MNAIQEALGADSESTFRQCREMIYSTSPHRHHKKSHHSSMVSPHLSSHHERDSIIMVKPMEKPRAPKSSKGPHLKYINPTLEVIKEEKHLL